MIIARAPMFVNLLGDPSYSDEAINAAIDKYVYVVINPTPLVNHVSARYSVTESVDNVKSLKNERIREALVKFGINNNIEIGSFASFPMEIGFKSFLSFTSALVCGLHSSIGSSIDNESMAKEVFEIEKKSLSTNNTMHGSYSAVSGGINAFSFKDGHFAAEQIFLDFHERIKFEDSIGVFYVKSEDHVKRVKKSNRDLKLSDKESVNNMVYNFKKALIKGNIEECAFLLHKSWMFEKNLGVNKSPDVISDIYDMSIASGAFGGKYIGDLNSGCLILIGEPKVFNKVEEHLKLHKEIATSRFKINFVQSGARTIFKLKS